MPVGQAALQPQMREATIPRNLEKIKEVFW
jgi:hypothetical protein